MKRDVVLTWLMLSPFVLGFVGLAVLLVGLLLGWIPMEGRQ